MKFITLTNHRSGSSHFQRLLHSHPDIVAQGERLLNPEHRNIDFLEKLMDNKYPNFGFKLMYSHIEGEVEGFMARDNIKVIQLIRRDILDTALWYGKHFSGGKGIVQARIPSVVYQMKRTYEWINKYRKYADFTVYYEDVTSEKGGQSFHNKKVRKQLLDFIGVEDRNLYSEINIKNIRLPSEQIVTNWEELNKAIVSAGLKRYYE